MTQACELEHGLACSYLYSAFTLKHDLREGGLRWDELQQVRLWAAQIYFVAAEEMLHLAQVWNLQTAIGGTPYYLRPNFPLPPNYYPLNLPVVLERFSLAALDRFIQYERPADVALVPESPIIGPAPPGFNTVGELYGSIASGFATMPEEELFIGYPDRQVGPDLVDFPNIVKVVDRESALDAIRTVTEQGEGLPVDRDDSHFGMFRGLRRAYLSQLAEAERSADEQPAPFQPVRQSISNPIAQLDPAFEAEGANAISDPNTSAVADAFDSVYGLMLRSLQYVFDNATSETTVLRALSRLALELMTTVLKPLGEALTRLPAGPEYEGQTAGPGFAIARHVPLPAAPTAATTMVHEKLRELSARLDLLATDPSGCAPAQLLSAARNLSELTERTQRAPGAAARVETGALALPASVGEPPPPDGRAIPQSTA